MPDTPVTLVTAAGSGMGEAIARRLHAAGHRLVLLSPGGGAAAVADDLGCHAVTGDITDLEDLQAMVDLATSEFGGIDNVVANTGHPPKGPLLEIPDEDWHAALDLVFLGCPLRFSGAELPVLDGPCAGTFFGFAVAPAGFREASEPREGVGGDSDKAEAEQGVRRA